MKLRIDHIVFNVEDEYAMVAFYGKVLLLSGERLEEYRRGDAPFPSIRVNKDTIIDFFPEKMWASHANAGGMGKTNLNHFCLAMDKPEWDSLRERLTSFHVAIEDGPVTRWGAWGKGISIYFRDPEENLIEARYYEAG